MKKSILFLVLFITIINSGFCQTVSFKDLIFLSNGKGEKALLMSKGFIISSTRQWQNGHRITYYNNNTHSHNAETIYLGLGSTTPDGKFLHDVSYFTDNISYINALISQIIQYKLHKVVKKKTKLYILYTFENNRLIVKVNIQRRIARQSSISLIHKF